MSDAMLFPIIVVADVVMMSIISTCSELRAACIIFCTRSAKKVRKRIGDDSMQSLSMLALRELQSSVSLFISSGDVW